MIRGTTPPFTLTIDGWDLTGMTIYVTLEQGATQLTLTNDRLTLAGDETGTDILFTLTQAETLAFAAGFVHVQVRFIDTLGRARATLSAEIRVDPILLDGEIEYQGGEGDG